MPIKNVFIACEESGVVRRAMRALGHHAWSCDLLPARDSSPYHIQGDVQKVLRPGHPTRVPTETGWALIPRWDIIIAHPPCDYLANSGVQWLTRTPTNPNPNVLYGAARRRAMTKAAAFFRWCLGLDCEGLAVENPIQHGAARAAIGTSYTQIVQPSQFGHAETKATCLWLRGLPPLVPTDIVPPPYFARVHREPPGPLRKLHRSETYPGIAAAMAAQWAGAL